MSRDLKKFKKFLIFTYNSEVDIYIYNKFFFRNINKYIYFLKRI